MSASLPPVQLAAVVVESLSDWRGQDVVDPEDQKLGKLEEIYYDVSTDQPTFVGIKSGRISKHLSIVSLQGASVGRDHLRVDWTKAEVKDAPSIDPGAEITEAVEVEAHRYFGLDHAPAGQSGRRLARR